MLVEKKKDPSLSKVESVHRKEAKSTLSSGGKAKKKKSTEDTMSVVLPLRHSFLYCTSIKQNIPLSNC